VSKTSTPPVRQQLLGQLSNRFLGELVSPGHSSYDRHRAVWNGSIDRRPAVIARCAGVSDVIRTIRAARETGLELAVRGGGHSFPGLSVVDDGVVLDLGLMKGVQVDPSAGTARVQAGVLLGEIDNATQAFGMAVPTGAVTHTGVAGLTLGGGIGWLMRKHGLSIDQLRSVDLVTAEGTSIRASGQENPELFWGVRGGGGNFGVVTEFEFDLNPVGPTVVSGLMLWPFDDAREVSSFYREWAGAAPDELTTALVLRKAPAIDLVPEQLHGRPVVGVIGCWAGPLEQGEAYWQPLRRFGRPVLDLVAQRPFLEQQAMLDDGFPHGVWVYMKACDVPALDNEVIDLSIDHASRMISPRSSVIAWQLGGAVSRADPDATAFGSRDAGYIFNISGITDDATGFDQERAWVRDYWQALLPYQSSVYVNFLMDADTDRIRSAYGPSNFDRLAALKTAYDPDNVFHLNQNIPPAPAG
jgi:FAD/FMN-containing dehydrogenase